MESRRNFWSRLTFSQTQNFFFFFGDTWVWTWGLTLGRQVLYNLSYAPSPFDFSYFPNRVSQFLPELAWTTILLLIPPSYLRLQPPYKLPYLAYLLRWGIVNFLLRLASNHHPPDLCFPRSRETLSRVLLQTQAPGQFVNVCVPTSL
jgi:hypothetical protein